MSDEQEAPIEILLVDDEPAILDLVERFLVRTDDRFSIRPTTSARDGLSLLRDGDFDAVVSDYDIPDMDGIAFLEAVRETNPELPFILFTGQGSEEVASRAISRGVTDYLQKSLGSNQYTVLANRISNAVERYRARRALERSQRRLSLLIDQSPYGVVEWTPDGEVARLNGAAEEILGFSSAELEGESWRAIVPESAYDRVGDVFAEIQSGGGGAHSVNQNLTKDGERIRCEWHNRAIVDDGAIVALISQFQDVTDRTARERELSELTQFRRAIIESANVWIDVLDRDGNVVLWNDAAEEISGYDRSEVIGHDAIWEWLYPDEEYREEIFSYATDILEGTAVAEEFETTIRTKDGDERTLSWHSRAMVDDDDDLIGSVAVARDVTAERTRKRELEQQNERLEEFARIVSHDLRNPLTVASGHLELARRERDGDHLREAAATLDRMDRLVTDLLAITRNDALHDEPVDLSDVVDRAWRTVDTDRAVLHDEVVGTVRADERLLRQLLENLVRNSVEHSSTSPRESKTSEDSVEHSSTSSQRGSRADNSVEHSSTSSRPQVDDAVDHGAVSRRSQITEDVPERRSTTPRSHVRRDTVDPGSEGGAEFQFDAGDTSSELTITVGTFDGGFYVEDDGTGVPAAERDRIFESGYSTSLEGTGYGLSIVKRVVDAHGWEIVAVESESGGARFEITGVETDRRSA